MLIQRDRLLRARNLQLEQEIEKLKLSIDEQGFEHIDTKEAIEENDALKEAKREAERRLQMTEEELHIREEE